MIEKRLLVPDRLRRPPREGFSWVDRRFLRELAPRLSGEAIWLYFFYCAVSDQYGLSFWGDTAISARLRLDEASIVRARRELVRRQLIAYERPLVQVLALPVATPDARRAEPMVLRDLFRQLEEKTP